MAIVRTKSSVNQVWFCVDEELPFGFRIAPAPLPVLPQFNSREYYDASPAVRQACWEVEKVEAEALGAALIAACARWQEAEARAAAERVPVPEPEPPAPAPLLNTAQAFVLASLDRMFAPGSLPSMYRRVVSARWTMAPEPSGSEWVRAVASFEMWDGLRGACHVEAECRGIRHARPTGTVDIHGDQVMRMVTSPSTWLSMGWDSMEGGPCVWEPEAGAWRRCGAELAA